MEVFHNQGFAFLDQKIRLPPEVSLSTPTHDVTAGTSSLASIPTLPKERGKCLLVGFVILPVGESAS
jgi:hypothetical protein